LRHPWLIGLSVLGVALGVAVVVAVDLANESARRAFMHSAQILAGRATHQVVGGPRGVAEAVYRRLRVDARVRASAPVVEGYARSLDSAERIFQIHGIDPFAEGRFRPYVTGVNAEGNVTRLLTEPATALMERRAAERWQIKTGDAFAVSVGGTPQRVTVVGMLQPADPVTRQALDSVLITDIATAQELLAMQGRLNRIDLIVPEGDVDLLRRIRSALPEGTDIVRAANRSHALDEMSRAFRVNLTALSLLALLVGTFLIYNIMTFSVIQRRTLLGTLRGLGVTRQQMFAHIITEALLIGIIGTVLGVLSGVILANGLIGHVVRTINDLYFVLSVGEVALAPLSLLKGVALGIGATTVAALAPAWEATRAPVSTVLRRSETETRVKRAAPRAAVLGLMIATLGTAVVFIPSRSLLLSYIGLFAIIVGFALLVPLVTAGLMRGLKPLMGATFGIPGRMATRGVVAALSRTGIAIAALAIAVSATIGVGIMITSFRDSFIDWLTVRLHADIYVAAPVVESGPSAPTLEPDLIERLTSVPGVASVSTGRWIRLQTADGITRLFVLDIAQENFGSYQLKKGDTGSTWTAFQHDEAVIVSEPYAYHHDLDLGDSIRLRTDSGGREFKIAGIYYDYGSDQGVIMMSRGTYDKYWHDPTITAMGIYARPGSDIEGLVEKLRQAAGGQKIRIRSNEALRAASLQVFDRTFAITAVLRLLATIVAFVGVLSALMALQLERARELAILRASGLTPRQVWRLVTAETGLMGFCSGLLAWPLGIAMALALILVINRRSFGWSLQVSIDPTVLIYGLLLAVVAALLAGLYPAFKMARTSPA
ncbi:MAG: FtsX-like permease family protein, partial [Acidiferrobacterales bacterium]